VESKVSKVDETTVVVVVQVNKDELSPIVNEVYGDVAKQINVPGFRKGRVPRTIINQRIGSGYIIEEVTNKAISKFYQQAALEGNLKVMGQPDIEVDQPYNPNDEAKGLEFTATVDVRPDITIPELSGSEVKLEIDAVTDDDVANRLELVRQQSSTKNADGEIEVPELSDDFATEVGFDSLDDLRTHIKESLEVDAIGASVGRAGDIILEQILDKLSFALPKKVVDSQVDIFLQNKTKEGETPTIEEREQARERAERDIRSQVVLDTYADEHDIKVAQNEVMNYCANMARQYGIDPADFTRMMLQNGQLSLLAAEVSRSKTLAHILRQVKVVDQNGKELDLSQWIGSDEDADDKAKVSTKKASAKKADTETSGEKVVKPAKKSVKKQEEEK
jgi:FKBP-type peptidyl-prolyl cis-trans isomerase (trigger factor)